MANGQRTKQTEDRRQPQSRRLHCFSPCRWSKKQWSATMAEEHGPGDPSICLSSYFGHWPFWFPFFLESCRSNPGIHWILHSDCGIPENAPPNVTLVETSFDDYCRQVSSALGIDFAPTNPYKLCDLKPALGLVHQEELKKYDFWAFGDLGSQIRQPA